MATDCGGCFHEMVDLRVTHPNNGTVVGRLCPNCNRVYLDELLNGCGTVRLDADRDEVLSDGD